MPDDDRARIAELMTAVRGPAKAPGLNRAATEPDNDTPAGAFLREAETLSPESDGFYHVIHEGLEVGAYCLDDLQEDDEVGVSLLKVRRSLEGQGVGSRMLDALCALADRHGVALRLEVVPAGRLSEAEIIDWYGRRGFERVEDWNPFAEGPAMCRSPQPVATPNLEDQMEPK